MEQPCLPGFEDTEEKWPTLDDIAKFYRWQIAYAFSVPTCLFDIYANGTSYLVYSEARNAH